MVLWIIPNAAGAALARRARAMRGDSGCRRRTRRSSTSQQSKGNRDLVGNSYSSYGIYQYLVGHQVG